MTDADRRRAAEQNERQLRELADAVAAAGLPEADQVFLMQAVKHWSSLMSNFALGTMLCKHGPQMRRVFLRFLRADIEFIADEILRADRAPN